MKRIILFLIIAMICNVGYTQTIFTQESYNQTCYGYQSLNFSVQLANAAAIEVTISSSLSCDINGNADMYTLSSANFLDDYYAENPPNANTGMYSNTKTFVINSNSFDFSCQMYNGGSMFISWAKIEPTVKTMTVTGKTGVSTINGFHTSLVLKNPEHAAIVYAPGTTYESMFGFHSNGGMYWGYKSGTSGAYGMQLNAGKLLVYSGLNVYTGSVGIGTTTPSEKVEVSNTTAVQTVTQYTNSSTGVNAGNGFITGIEAAGNGVIWNRENNFIRFGTNNIERLRIAADGKVGIGNNNDPKSKLDVGVQHIYNQDEEMRIGSVYNNLFYGIGLNYRLNNVGTPSTHLVNYSGGVRNTAITLSSNGNVLVGKTTQTDATNKLDVAGNIGIDGRLVTSGDIIMKQPVVTGTWARGFDFWNKSNLRWAGIGIYGTGDTQNNLYMATGESPWSNGQGIYVAPTSNVGVGRIDPACQLDILTNGTTSPKDFVARIRQTTTTGTGSNSNALLAFSHSNVVSGSGNYRDWYIGTGSGTRFGHPDNFGICDATANLTRLIINTDGNVLVGKTTQNDASYKLDVNGKIRATEVMIESPNTADFVFADDYKLNSLDSVKNFISANRHLPGVPSAADMQQNGVGLNQMNALLLQKVEELTLYLLKQNEKIAEQDARMLMLEKQLQQK